jgi:hypothetical protein
MFRPGLYPAQLPKLIRKVLYLLLWLASRMMFIRDRTSLPLHERDWPLYLDIHIVSWLRLRSFPRLRDPRSLNDQIRWMMLFSQDRILPNLCDKLAVRQWVREKAGEAILVPLIASGNLQTVFLSIPGKTGVLKCTHDSGSAMIIRNPQKDEIARLQEKFEVALSKKYGIGKGEWPYGLVRPNLIFEELLPGTQTDISPPDIKVHCVSGEPRAYQVIANRHSIPEGAIFLPSGERLEFDTSSTRQALNDFPIGEVIQKAEPIARLLSEGLGYVRVDLYLSEGNIFFGELTFFPESGLFTHKDADRLSAVLKLRTSDPKPSVYDSRTESLL